LEPVVESAIETGATAISIRPRLSFGSSDTIISGIFTKTDDDIALHPAYLPSRDLFVAWARRLKARHTHLQTFKVAIAYSTFETDAENFPENNEMLVFKYCEAEMDAESYSMPDIRDNMDLRNQQVDADAHQFQYQIYPDAIRDCYHRVLQDAEILRQEEEREVAHDMAAAGVAVDHPLRL
jgi:hypothetical protein